MIIEPSKSKKKAFVIVSAALLILFAVFAVAYPAVKQALNSGVVVDYHYDVTDLKTVVGLSDYVFVAKVEKVEGTYFQKDTSGKPMKDSPATMYRLTVVQNIKGTLSTSRAVLLYKDGGQLSDGTMMVYPDDTLPEVGSYYVFAAGVEGGASSGVTTALPVGTLGSSGMNSTILLGNEETQALKSSKIADFTAAFKNQKQINRTRYPIQESKVYLDK